jgi:hypothetical protein
VCTVRKTTAKDLSPVLDGTIAAIRARNYGSDSSAGYVQVFRFENNTWTHCQLGNTTIEKLKEDLNYFNQQHWTVSPAIHFAQDLARFQEQK